jgi:hypothetical protein
MVTEAAAIATTTTASVSISFVCRLAVRSAILMTDIDSGGRPRRIRHGRPNRLSAADCGQARLGLSMGATRVLPGGSG